LAVLTILFRLVDADVYDLFEVRLVFLEVDRDVRVFDLDS